MGLTFDKIHCGDSSGLQSCRQVAGPMIDIVASFERPPDTDSIHKSSV